MSRVRSRARPRARTHLPFRRCLDALGAQLTVALLALSASEGTAQEAPSAPLVCPALAGVAAGERQPRGWSIDFRASESDPVIEDGYLFVGSADGSVYAFDACSGDEVWRFETGSLADLPDGVTSLVNATPLLRGGTLYIGARDSIDVRSPPPDLAAARPNFFALDAATGELRWWYAVPAGVERTAVVDDRHVYFASRTGAVYALGTTDGRLAWAHAEERRVDPSLLLRRGAPVRPVLLGDRIYSRSWPPSGVDTIYALAAADGAPLWSATLENLRRGPEPVGEHLLAIAGVRPGALHALRASDGATAWSYEPDGARDLERVVADDTNAYLAVGREIVSLDLSTGVPVWSAQPAAFVLDLDMGDGVLAVSSGRVFRVDPTTGDAQALTGDIGAIAVVAVLNGVGIIAGFDSPVGYTEAVDLRTGDRRWRFSPGATLLTIGAPVQAGSRVFVRTVGLPMAGGGRGYLRSLDARTGR